MVGARTIKEAAALRAGDDRAAARCIIRERAASPASVPPISVN